MNRLVKIKPIFKGLVLDIELGDMCNYACSYCHPNTNSGRMWIDYDKLVNFIKIKRPKFIILGGGEPSIYPQIEELLLFTKDIDVMMVTNCSRTIKWWEKTIDLIEYPVLSYHFEFADFNDFMNIVNCISDKKCVKINVSMIHDKFDECLSVAKKLKSVKNTNVVMKILKNRKTQALFNYTQDQLNIMKENNRSFEISKDIICQYESGEQSLHSASDLIVNGDNSYSGWLCYKGINLLKITPSGKVFKASCDMIDNNFLCDIDHPEKTLSLKPEICKKNRCYCTPDLRVIKKEVI